MRADLESVFLQLTGPEGLEADLMDDGTEGAAMTRLARVELRRLLRRRLTLFVVLGILLAVGLQVFQTGMQARPTSASERARVSADYERARQDFAQNGEQQRQDCLQSQAEARTSDPTADFGCDTMEPTLAMFLKPELRFAGEVPGVLTGGAVLLALAALVLGAGFTASEFTHRVDRHLAHLRAPPAEGLRQQAAGRGRRRRSRSRC